MWKKIKIGYSQIPQIIFFVAGFVMMFMFECSDNGLYAILTLFCMQFGITFMNCYDDTEEEKKSETKANAEAIEMLESKVHSNG
jgi:hypothetical protein